MKLSNSMRDVTLIFFFQAVDTVVQVLKEIEEVAPSKDQYSNLCLLLTMNKLSDHPDYKSWNPSKGRHKSFREVLPLVEDLLGKMGKTIGNEVPCITLFLVLGQTVFIQIRVSERSIFQTFWRPYKCTDSLFSKLETSNTGYLLIFDLL